MSAVEKQYEILAIVPVSVEDREGLDYEPGPNMIHFSCEKCETVCWIGPNQLQKKKDNSTISVLCPKCALEQLRKWKEEDNDFHIDIKTLT